MNRKKERSLKYIVNGSKGHLEIYQMQKMLHKTFNTHNRYNIFYSRKKMFSI